MLIQKNKIYHLKTIPLRRFIRERRSEVADDYIVFLQEHGVDIRVIKMV